MAALPTVIQTQARKQGYLSKTGGKSLSGWKKRWFVLDDESLRYFTDNSVRIWHENRPPNQPAAS
jgi:hypothetical protein